MPIEIKKYAGNRIPAFGTPLAIVGINNDGVKKSISYEIHVFTEGRTKFYYGCELQSDYEHLDAEHIASHIETTNKIVDDEIDKTILDAMAGKDIPSNLFSKLTPIEPKDFSTLLYSLWSRGSYDAEIKNIAHTSKIPNLRTEFTAAMQLPKIKFTISALR